MPDFTITVTANTNPEVGPVADDPPPDDSTIAHIRNHVRGQLLLIAGQLPAGWNVEVETLSETGSSSVYLGHLREIPEAVPVRDAFAEAESTRCERCGLTLRRDRPDGVWYHVPDCVDPTPQGEFTAVTGVASPLAIAEEMGL